MQKQILLVLFFLLTFPGVAAPFGEITAGGGVDVQGDIVTLRAEFLKSTPYTWFESEYGLLRLFLSLSADRWQHGGDTVYAAAAAPVGVYDINRRWKGFRPFIEAGLGAAYVSETRINKLNLGIHFQFQDFLGAGIRMGKDHRQSIRVRFLHYSNANIDDSNSGISFFMLSYGYRF